MATQSPPLPASLYVSDPLGAVLGRKILTASAPLLRELGLEKFTFRKLAVRIGSTEAGVYRYFRSKYQLLAYLANTYWATLHESISRHAARERSPWMKLRRALEALVTSPRPSAGTCPIDSAELHRLMQGEGQKVFYLAEIPVGALERYRSLIQLVQSLIKKVNPRFDNSLAFASTLCQAAHGQQYLARRLPGSTDLPPGSELEHGLVDMLWNWTTRLLAHQTPPMQDAPAQLSIFITRFLRADSPLRQYADTSGHVITGRSFLRFAPLPFVAPERSDWWFFYSARAAKFCLLHTSLPEGVRLAALGEGTAQTVRELTGRVDFVGAGAPNLVAEQFLAVAAGTRVFFPRAQHSLRTIQLLLADQLTVLDAVCYDNTPAPVTEPISADVLIFTSPLNVAAYLDHQQPAPETQLLAIGGRTASALYERGYAARYPATPSEEALVDLLRTMT